MSQSKKKSLAEALTNTVGGYGINLLVQLAIYPWFGAHFTIGQNLQLGGVFFMVSLVRGYGVRRFFSWLDRRVVK
jgi:hypothetical protein